MTITPLGAPAAPDYEELVQETRVNARLYTDPQIFRDEMDRIYRRGWVYAAHDSEVEKPGSYITRMIGDQPVVVLRDRDGEVRVFFNRCPHRGATICSDASGQLKAIRCAYHGWTFNLKGELMGAPMEEAFGENFDRANYGLAPVPRMEVYRGFVFVSLTEGEMTLDEHLGESKVHIDQFVEMSPGGEVRLAAGRLKTTIPANWKMMMENVIDPYHGPFLHRSSIPQLMSEGGTTADFFGDESLAKNTDMGMGHGAGDFREQNAAGGGTLVAYNGGVEKEYIDEYVAELAERVGEERAKEIFSQGLSVVRIWPNLGLLGQDVRVVNPMAPDKTLLIQSPALVTGESKAVEEANVSRIATQTLMYSVAGRVGPDDHEVYERNQVGLNALQPEWLTLLRGAHRDVELEDGQRIGKNSDETAIRGFWRYYRELMSADRA